MTLIEGLIQPQGLAIDHHAGKLYWTEVSARSLSRANLDGSNVEVVVKPSKKAEDAPYGVALDTKAGKVYWTTQCCTIRRANFDGTGLEHIVSATYTSGIALDVDAGKMYWTTWIGGLIWRANLNGTGQEILISQGVQTPIDLALDPIRRKIYWADVGKRTVERASMDDGSGMEVLNVSWAIQQTNGISLDPQGARVYLTGSEVEPGVHSGSIYRANLNGDDSEVIISQSDMRVPYGIAYDSNDGAVYWTDQQLGTIQRLLLRCTPGMLTVPSRDNNTITEISYGNMNHGGLQTYECPENYTGHVRFMCKDGHVSLSSGSCARDCPAGHFSQANGTSVEHGTMIDGETLKVGCGEHLVGPVELVCSDGEVQVQSGECRVPRDCPAGVSRLIESAQIRHGPLEHGGRMDVDCPQGFNGSYVLGCRDGVIYPVTGVCRASCEAGGLWVDNGGGAVMIQHSTIRPGRSLRVACPDGSAGEGVELECMGDYVRVVDAQCTKISRCPEGRQDVNGAVIYHTAMGEGDLKTVDCPDSFTGSVNLTCSDSTITMTGMCYQDCVAGTIRDNQLIEIPHSSAAHDSIVVAACPTGYTGVIPLQCHDGNFSVYCPEVFNSSRCACQPLPQEATVSVPIGTLAPFVAALLLSVLAICLVRYAKRCRKTPPSGPAAAGSGLPSVPRAAARCIGEALGIHPGAVPAGPGGGGPGGGAAAALPGCGGAGGGGSSLGLGRSGSSSTLGGSSGGGSGLGSEMAAEGGLVPLPSYWATTEGVHTFMDPNRIPEIERLMNETWRVCYTRDRMLLGGGTRLPVGCRVANVLRIENHRGYSRFWQRMAHVSARRGGSIEAFPMITDGRLNLLEEGCNQKYLFHGTSPEAADNIARNLFQISMAGTSRGCMFGPGIYLAENASKSDEYAKEGSGVYAGLCAMLLCRAVSGRVLTVDRSADFSEQVRGGAYDSVCGDRLAAAGTFREMVYFHEEAVYPEFVVIYARTYGDD